MYKNELNNIQKTAYLISGYFPNKSDQQYTKYYRCKNDTEKIDFIMSFHVNASELYPVSSLDAKKIKEFLDNENINTDQDKQQAFFEL